MKKNKQKHLSKFSLKPYLKNNKWGIAAYLLTFLMSTITDIFTVIYSAEGIAAVSEGFYEEGVSLLIIVASLYLFSSISYWVSHVVFSKTLYKTAGEINADLIKQAFKIDSASYARNDTGKIVNRITSDPQSALMNLGWGIEIVSEIVSAFVILTYIFTLNIYIGIAMIVIISIAMIIERARVKKYKKHNVIARKESDKLYSISNEMVRSEKDIKSMNLEERLSQSMLEKFNNFKDARLKQEIVNRKYFSIRNILLNVGTFAILIWGVHLINLALITLSTFIIIYSNRGSIRMLAWNLGNIANFVVQTKLSIKRMAALYDGKTFTEEKYGTVTIENMKGQIEFKKVAFSYLEQDAKKTDEEEQELFYLSRKQLKKKQKEREQLNKDKDPKKTQVFKNLSFTIKPNTTVAFVGESGSGKSTILSLIGKMYDTDGGQILIDGIDIKQLDKPTIRKNFTLVNQYPYIFDMSIKENLLMANKDATDKELVAALKKAALDKFVSTLPKGLDTVVGESGVRLSGGQKQRLAIARAMLKETKILMFDESTSSLDNFAQNDIKKSIDKLKGSSTIIIVAHRLSTIKNVDTIYFLDKGKIIDSGTFEQLFERNEKFKILFLAENLN